MAGQSGHINVLGSSVCEIAPLTHTKEEVSWQSWVEEELKGSDGILVRSSYSKENKATKFNENLNLRVLQLQLDLRVRSDTCNRNKPEIVLHGAGKEQC